MKGNMVDDMWWYDIGCGQSGQSSSWNCLKWNCRIAFFFWWAKCIYSLNRIWRRSLFETLESCIMESSKENVCSLCSFCSGNEALQMVQDRPAANHFPASFGCEKASAKPSFLAGLGRGRTRRSEANHPWAIFRPVCEFTETVAWWLHASTCPKRGLHAVGFHPIPI